MNWKIKLILWVFGIIFVLGFILKALDTSYGAGQYLAYALLILMGLLIMSFWGNKETKK